MAQFPHLQLQLKITGAPLINGMGPEPDENTKEKLANRLPHADFLEEKREKLDEFWSDYISERKQKGLPDLPEPEVVPLLLTVDPKSFDIEALKGFGIEIIAEEENGFIIGASIDNFKSLSKKIDQFRQEQKGGNGVAKLWEIEEGIQWKIERILSPYLLSIWQEIKDKEEYTVDISIACYIKMPDKPLKASNDSDEKYQKKVARWEKNLLESQIAKDDLAISRQDRFDAFLEKYNGARLDSWVEFNDSFCSRIKVSGQALKDIVFSYQYLFDVTEVELIEEYKETERFSSENEELNILSPSPNAPKVCVIDSGIQEGHKLLANAIDVVNSYNFLEANNTNITDEVMLGGHGTRVAGAILFPKGIPAGGSDYQLPFWIQNARVLNRYYQENLF